jgi:hypothetical protein
MYIIVTSKPEEYTAEPGSGIAPVETWNYVFYGRVRSVFTIGEVTGDDARVKIVDEADPACVNWVPAKFFGAFDTLDAARHELEELTRFGAIDARLEPAA